MTQEQKKMIEELSVSAGYLTSWYISSVDDTLLYGLMDILRNCSRTFI